MESSVNLSEGGSFESEERGVLSNSVLSDKGFEAGNEILIHQLA